jgi:hypothetical protein
MMRNLRHYNSRPSRHTSIYQVPLKSQESFIMSPEFLPGIPRNSSGCKQRSYGCSDPLSCARRTPFNSRTPPIGFFRDRRRWPHAAPETRLDSTPPHTRVNSAPVALLLICPSPS